MSVKPVAVDPASQVLGVKGTSAEKQALLKACEEFESVMMEQMLKSMRSTVPRTGLDQSFGQEMTQEMYDEQLAGEMSKSGGVGLAQILFKQLSATLPKEITSGDNTTKSATKEIHHA